LAASPTSANGPTPQARSGAAFPALACAADAARRRAEDNWIALAGPLSHIPQGLFWLLLGAETVPVSALSAGPSSAAAAAPGAAPRSSDYAALENDFWLQLCSFGLLLQFILFFTNTLLPVYPLDGGRLMVNALSSAGVGLEAAAYMVSSAGLAVGGVIFGLGLLGSATQAAFGGWVLWSSFSLRQKAARGEADFDPLFAHYTGGPPVPAYAPGGAGGGGGGFGLAPGGGAAAPSGAMYGATAAL